MKSTTFIIFTTIAVVLYSCNCISAFGQHIDLTSQVKTVELFAPEIISTSNNERDLAISPQGDELFYTFLSVDNTIRCIIWVKLDSNSEVISKEIAPFSGFYKDIEPAFSPDGNRLYFASNRPTSEMDNKLDFNIWYVEKKNNIWGEPVNPGEMVNTDMDEFYPSIGESGNLYFTASYKDSKGAEDIYMCEYKDGEYQKPVSLDSAVNTKFYEFNAYVSPKEDVLIFTSFGRPDELGGGDLYISRKSKTGQWTPAVNMGPGINSKSIDYCPFVDWKNHAFYFTSNRKEAGSNKRDFRMLLREQQSILNGIGNIFRVGTISARIE